MGTALGPKYILYSYMDPVGVSGVFGESCGVLGTVLCKD